MLYTFNFSPSTISKMIEMNLPYIGRKGMQKDAEIIYLYLIQKYSFLEISQILSDIEGLMTLSSEEINKRMRYLESLASDSATIIEKP